MKESDDGSDESTAARSKNVAAARRKTDPRQTSQRWSHVKISFDNDSVRLESEMAAQQAAGGGGERGGSAMGNTNPTLMTASSSLSATGGTMALSSGAPSAVPPTIKIIGKEVSPIRPKSADQSKQKIIKSSRVAFDLAKQIVTVVPLA